MPKKTSVELIENFLVLWNPEEGSNLYRSGYYGKPLGIAKPKIPEFDAPLILDLMEGFYLYEKGAISIFENGQSNKVGKRRLRLIARQLYEGFDEKYTVYRDFRERGFVVTPGIKFGCDFAVYKYGPGVEHAPYMVSVKKEISELSATEIVQIGRLATTVRKRFIIAMLGDRSRKIDYLIFKWFKA